MSDDYKIISISQKRRITIPQKYFARFSFGGHAKISVIDNGILIEPAENISNSNSNGEGEFDVQILQELVKEGLTGEELISAFNKYRAKVPAAIEAMKEEAHNIACGMADFDSFDDVFGED